MMRLCFALAALLAALPACGGSSSETPPPLEPDPRGFHYSSAPTVQDESSDAGDSQPATDPDDAKPHSAEPVDDSSAH